MSVPSLPLSACLLHMLIFLPPLPQQLVLHSKHGTTTTRRNGAGTFGQRTFRNNLILSHANVQMFLSKKTCFCNRENLAVIQKKTKPSMQFSVFPKTNATPEFLMLIWIYPSPSDDGWGDGGNSSFLFPLYKRKQVPLQETRNNFIT